MRAEKLQPKIAKYYARNTIEPNLAKADLKEITENDYILSASTYSPCNGEEEISHRDPKEILKEIESDEKKLGSALSEIKKLL